MQHLKSMLLFFCMLFFLATPAAWAAGPLVNMTVTDADVRDVLTSLAAVGQVNMVVDDSVQGTITIQLRDVPFTTALDIVARTKGLTYQVEGNVVVVGKSDQMGRGFGNIHIFKLKYAKPEDFAQTVSLLFDSRTGTTGTATKTTTASETAQTQTSGSNTAATATASGRVRVDDETNSIIFYGTQAEANKVSQLLTELDVPCQQISLEAEVVAITKSASKDLGVDWKWASTPDVPNNTTNSTTTDTSTTTSTTTRDYPGVIRYGRNPDGIPYEFQYQATISALVTKGKANILAKPKITAINGKEAHILIGDRLPVMTQTVSTNGQTTNNIDYVEAGIKLNYTPRINADGQITAKVKTEVSTPTLVSELKAYRITTREAETEVRMRDGETMVIGGLINSDESESQNSVPFLSDIPILGKLFQSNSKSKDETEIVIFLTPHIVK